MPRRMKVIRSKRLENVLRDPAAAEQLRVFLASATVGGEAQMKIETRDAEGKPVCYWPKLLRVFGSGA
ncbi:hypothetical protein [Cupriavidus plantarum]|uniref:Uncharacterized protein n=1 Tax=Cupriavidus plantarum TaxID=942865 RepID=A0A316ELU9_9BURK|nr:hypothetical protein [Cupriavidus plantarum]PWK31905.1 hypothetical protein C7419_10845 [Cupriavidus plantarum]REE86344.1 hypothetical protein C7418_5520 [Cupriavidus plantarum]RLK29170.1 hypothetical protein C7417_5549 [Cupriavidus plantarum]